MDIHEAVNLGNRALGKAYQQTAFQRKMGFCGGGNRKKYLIA
jgi:hypothetical protein